MTELEFLAEIKSYVEKTQEAIDGEWGDGRSISQLIADGKMPQPIYSEIIRRIEAFHQKSRQDHLLDQARSIRDEIEMFVFGPSGTETPACAEAWATAKLIAELRSRVEALEAAAKPVESNYPAEPDSSLVERVAGSLTTGLHSDARAAILAVADWLDQQHLHTTAARLRQEVRR
jgi:hypothetical protein